MRSGKADARLYAVTAALGIGLGIVTIWAYYYFVFLSTFVCYGNVPQHAPPPNYSAADTRLLIIVVIDAVIALALYRSAFSKNFALLGIFILLLVLTAWIGFNSISNIHCLVV